MLVKILTVSDGVVSGTRQDRSGEALERLFVEHGDEVVDRRCVADGVTPVASVLMEMASDFWGLIVTTGGTGFSERDLTPEATRSVIAREAPGISEAMRATNPLGRLSRGVAGTLGRSLILNVPGSPAGATESIGAVIDILDHALGLMVSSQDPHPTHTSQEDSRR